MGDRRENLAFGQRIRAAMAVARVSRQDVARACGIIPQGVQRWCDGTSYPSSSKLITFCNMTGCSAEWLLWQHPVDIRSTDWAINGTHIKNIVRQAMDDLAAEQSTPPITPDADTAAIRSEDAKTDQPRMSESDFDCLILDAMAEAMKAMRKFPQPNYVISKIAEEAGEVVKAAIHCAEGRETAENLRGEMKQLIAMIYRLWVEGDQVHGLPSVYAATIAEAAAIRRAEGEPT